MKGSILVSVIATATLGAPAFANDIEAVDSGWYNQSGGHSPGNVNYFVGVLAGDELRNFFVFDLSDVDGTIVEASLRIYNPPDGFRSDEGVETYRLHEVTTGVEALLGGTGGVAAYDDLGTGTVLGEVNALVRDIEQTITVPLNDDGLAVLNAAEGLVALGGVLPNASDSDVALESVFGFSAGDAAFARVVFRTESDPVAVSAVGVRTAAVLCENLTDPQTVVVPRPEAFQLFSVDCEAAGLSASAGDELRIVISGTANSSREWLNGFVTGMDVNDPITCVNLTQSSVEGWVQDDGIWDCRRSPLGYTAGDDLRVVITGVAE